MLKSAKQGLVIALAWVGAVGCASTGGGVVEQDYHYAFESSFEREAKDGDRVHVKIDVEPSALIDLAFPLAKQLKRELIARGFEFVDELEEGGDPVQYHCQVFVRYFGPIGEKNRRHIYNTMTTEPGEDSSAKWGPLGEADIRGGLPGWFDSKGYEIETTRTPAKIPQHVSSGPFGGGGSYGLVVDISTGSLMQDRDTGEDTADRICRSFRIVGPSSATDRENAWHDLFERRVVTPAPPAAEGEEQARPTVTYVEDLSEVAKNLVNAMVPTASFKMREKGARAVAEMDAAGTPR